MLGRLEPGHGAERRKAGRPGLGFVYWRWAQDATNAPRRGREWRPRRGCRSYRGDCPRGAGSRGRCWPRMGLHRPRESARSCPGGSGSARVFDRSRSIVPFPLRCGRHGLPALRHRPAFRSVAQRLGDVGFCDGIAFGIVSCSYWTRLVPGQAGGQEVGLQQVVPPQGLHQGGVLHRFTSASLSMPSSRACGRRRRQRRLQLPLRGLAGAAGSNVDFSPRISRTPQAATATSVQGSHVLERRAATRPAPRSPATACITRRSPGRSLAQCFRPRATSSGTSGTAGSNGDFGFKGLTL